MGERWRSDILCPLNPNSDDGIAHIQTERNAEENEVVIPCSGWFAFCFGHSGDVCDCACVLHTVSLSDKNATEFALPFRDATSETLNAISIGKLVFLKKETTVSVRYTNNSAPCAAGTCPIRWRLVFQRSEDDCRMHKKTIYCVFCRRLFDTVSAAHKHQRSLHIDNSPLWAKTPLSVQYQDDSLAVVMKPQGVPVMGDKVSLSRSNLFLTLRGGADDAMNKPVAAHRLDAATGGLLLVAKTKAAEISLKNSFSNKLCKKRYRALVVGRLEPKTGTVKEAIKGKEAVTHYRVVNYSRSLVSPDEWVTVVDLFPVTGRKHQLRRHAKSLGHPIWGDKRYGPKGHGIIRDTEQQLLDSDVVKSDQEALSRLCLWAMEITFPHPTTGDETTVTMDDPLWLKSVVQYHAAKWQKQKT